MQRSANKPRSEVDLREIRSIISGLREIHKNFEFVKTALSHAVTYEKHEGDVRIEKKKNEAQMSCYYILSGSIEAFYTVRNNSWSLPHKERTISYTNVAGDYIGQLSADGPNFDLPSPESMNTIGHCEFLRIDRAVFHEKIQEAQRLFRNEIVQFLNETTFLSKITEEDRAKLVLQMAKQVGEYFKYMQVQAECTDRIPPAGKQILYQGQKQEHAFFVAKGRCVYHRRIYLPEQNRSELFKMGYIERGSYFDATCILDDQNSRFSVSAVGPVTCYLLNKWTIKNSESLLRAFATNRPSFPTDKEIECLVRESDEWQSYKRDAVCDAFVTKQKATSRIVPQSNIPPALDAAIKHGISLRLERRKDMISTPSDDLDLSSRRSRASSSQSRESTVKDNTTSVLKAVMLMKRSRGSIQKDNSEDMLSSSNQHHGNRLKPSSKRDGLHSAPELKHWKGKNYCKVDGKISMTELKGNGQRQTRKQYENSSSNLVHKRSKTVARRGISSKAFSAEELLCKQDRNRPKTVPNGNPQTLNGNPASNQCSFTRIKKKNGSQLEARGDDRPRSTPTSHARGQEKKGVFDDRWVTHDKKFKVKQIVNTRIPGRENPVEDQYRRFEPSMFTYLDTINNFDKEKEIDPCGAKLKSAIWLKKAKEKLATGGRDYNPGRSPIIVIEEFCAGNEGTWDEESGYESHGKKKIKDSAASMEMLLEDSDKENVAEEVRKDEWITSVHETRHEAEHCIEQARNDIEMLEKKLFQLGWTPDMLNEKERIRNERRKRSCRSSNEDMLEEDVEPQRKIDITKTKQPQQRKHKMIKRQDSIQKILEKKDLIRRHQSWSEEEKTPNRKPTLVKRYSTGSAITGNCAQSRTRILRTRTSTVS
ncbi:uncharacterized protein LOC114517945 [Dendronephthya gigantea]|uniref:uncharacterized protein LOC114517945 n=1 Tax=Dendronephthya gigantea TaxID=151771 RepID=UPI00106C3ECF|nr:uncharacterized protein LOC114517945 [Dendronephthya gigantea]